MSVSDVGSELTVGHCEPGLLQVLPLLRQGSLMSVKTDLMGCDPLWLIFKPGIDRSTVDLEVLLFL
jgi:hypothetical protein